MSTTYDVVVTLADGQECFVLVGTDKESAESAWNVTLPSLARGQSLRLIKVKFTPREQVIRTVRSVIAS